MFRGRGVYELRGLLQAPDVAGPQLYYIVNTKLPYWDGMEQLKVT